MEHEFATAEEIAEHFSATMPWFYKHFAKRVPSRLTADGRKVYDLTRTLELFAEEAHCEIYSVPCAGPWRSPRHYRPSHRPKRVRIAANDHLRNRIAGGEELWTAGAIAEYLCSTDTREMAYRYVYDHAWFAFVYGGKTLYLPREVEPEFAAPAVEALSDAATVTYLRSAKRYPRS